MIYTLRPRWKQIRKPLGVIIIVSFVLILALVSVTILGYLFNWKWAGLDQKTLWDWLQLLIIPVVLAVGGYLFNFTTSSTEREIAVGNQHEELLQTYIDRMSELMLEKHLRESSKEDEVRTLARVRTLTVLARLDRDRKKSVLQFLHEAGLIKKDLPIIELNGADLSKADLVFADLRGANLSRVNLSGADLTGANLSEAYLEGAELREANLTGARMEHAYLARADLIRAKMQYTFLDYADLRGALLVEADLRGAELKFTNLDTAFLSKARLSDASLMGASLRGADLDDVQLDNANLSKAVVTQDQLNRVKTAFKTIMP